MDKHRLDKNLMEEEVEKEKDGMFKNSKSRCWVMGSRGSEGGGGGGGGAYVYVCVLCGRRGQKNNLEVCVSRQHER